MRARKSTLRLVMTVRKQKSSSPETSTAFHSKSPCEHCENSNVYWTLIMKCPKCVWHVYYKICPICDHQIPDGRNYMKEGFRRCHDWGAVTHKNAKTLETNFQGRNQVYGIRDHSPGIEIIDPGSWVTSHGIRISHFLCVTLRDQGSSFSDTSLLMRN